MPGIELKNVKVVSVSDEQIIQTSKGDMRKRNFVIEEVDGKEYTNKLEIEVSGKDSLLDTVAALQYGDSVTVKANVQSREYKGRYYTSVKAWSVYKTGNSYPTAASSGGASYGGETHSSHTQYSNSPQQPLPQEEAEDDLPF